MVKISRRFHQTAIGVFKKNPIIRPISYGSEIRFDIQQPDILKKNSDLLRRKAKVFNKIKSVRVGDYLEYSPGAFTRFTHKWDDSIQTGGSSGSSYFLGDGYLSYSGSLDDGVKITDVILTKKKKKGSVWFFSEDLSGGGRGVHYIMNFRVYKLKKNADVSGLGG
jgi:hypothetical protein